MVFNRSGHVKIGGDMTRPESTPGEFMCAIDFRIYDDGRYAQLIRFFEILRRAMSSIQKTEDIVTGIPSPLPPANAPQAGPAPSSAEAEEDATQESRMVVPAAGLTRAVFLKPEQWLLYFTPQDLQALHMPEHVKALSAVRNWQDLNRKTRRNAIGDDQGLQTLADFVDMLAHFYKTSLQLVGCERLAPDCARITYTSQVRNNSNEDAIENLLIFFGFLMILNRTC